MRLVIQRVLQAEVQVNENTVGKINKGLLVFVGAGHEDSREVADKYLKGGEKISTCCRTWDFWSRHEGIIDQ